MKNNNKKLHIILTISILVFLIVLPVLFMLTRSQSISMFIQNRIMNEYAFIGKSKTYRIPQKIVRDEARVLKYGKHIQKTVLEEKVKNDTIILLMALKDGTLKEPLFEDFIWYTIKKGIAEYYIKTAYHRENKTDYTLRKKAVAAFYVKNKRMYDNLKLSKKDAYAIIAQNMQQHEYLTFTKKVINKFKLDHTVKIGK